MSLQPLFVTSGFNLAIMTLLIPFEVAEMDGLTYPYTKQMQIGMLSLACLGVGKLIGRIIFRPIYYDHPLCLGAIVNFFALFMTYILIFAFHSSEEFD